MAISAKMIGSSSQEMEFLMDMELCLRDVMIIMNNMIVAIVISIWMFVMMIFS